MKTNFNKDWKFYLGDLAPHTGWDRWSGAKAKACGFGAAAASLDDSKWRRVTLPHDFVSEGEYSRRTSEGNDMRDIPEMESIDSRLFAAGSLEGGIGWYRKHFDLNIKQGQRVLLHFEGVYRNSTIFINEYYVQSHTGGYDSFIVDATDFVNLQGENLIAVRVDSTGREGWWYEGGGIYRNVWLEIKEEVYLEPWGVQVTYDLYDGNNAIIKINAEVNSKALSEKNLRMEHHLLGTDSRVEEELSVESWESQKVYGAMNAEKITLWDLNNPHLYKLVTRLYEGDTLLDEEETTIGFRSLTFDAEKGFFLNDRYVKIQGLCCHQDHAGVGIACYKDIWEYRFKQMKGMGMNAYRSAHHMMAQDVLDLCDELGILVMGESRRMSSAPEDLEAMETLVKMSRNHPSVFIWSIGNEEIFSQDKPETIRTTITLKKLVEKLDGTRPITSAVVCWNGVERFDTAEKYEDVTQHLDVMGFNYCRTAWDPYHVSKPEQPIIVTEASANSGTRGCYETNEDAGQYYILDPENESKCKSGKKAVRKDMAEDEWKYVADRDFLMGTFLWTGMDYRGEPTPLSYPSVYSHFGILDYCGFAKDNFYYWKSWWQQENVMHLFPHWNHQGKEGQPLTIYCYSNLDEVELFVNGERYGKKAMEKNWYLSWENVIYQPGVLSAKGYRNGEVVLEEKVETTGYASRLTISPVKEQVVPDGMAIFNISVEDEQGKEVPTANPLVYIHVSGGEFVGTGNGNPGDHDSEKRPVRRAFHGKLQVIVRAKEAEKIVVKVTAEGLQSADSCVIIE
ncbi:MAG: DUF4982 domain-containing protein [Lachnospiraceae bacterium]|nr:DUF4982 domain-containing protein [Lachnospiraceae bacterium]